MSPTNIKIAYKTKLGVGLTETQGFEEWLKMISNFFDKLINLFFYFFDKLLYIQAYDQKQEEHKTTTYRRNPDGE